MKIFSWYMLYALCIVVLTDCMAVALESACGNSHSLFSRSPYSRAVIGAGPAGVWMQH